MRLERDDARQLFVWPRSMAVEIPFAFSCAMMLVLYAFKWKDEEKGRHKLVFII